MTEVPKEVPEIVLDRLQTSSPQSASEQSHLDAEQLTAFAEQAMSASERDSALEHLVRCMDCRDVLALALPAATIVGTPIVSEIVSENVSENDALVALSAAPHSPRKRTSSVFAWPSLRWAALAAGVAVAGSVLLIHPGKLNQLHPTTPHSASSQIADPQSASLRQPQPEVNIAGNPSADKSEPYDRNKVSDRVLIARNDAPPGTSPIDARPIEKAKPAAPGTEVQGTDPQGPEANQQQQAKSPSGLTQLQTSSHPTENVTWTLSGGVLQRSLDRGLTWQNALHADHSLLCYANNGRDVWTGGQAGALFHSADNGVTWVRIPAAVDGNSQQLAADVIRIDLKSDSPDNRRTTILVSTSNHEVWSSADGGQTWDKN